MNLSSFKQNARNSLKGKWGTAILASLIASLLGSNGSINFDFNLNESESFSWGALITGILFFCLGIIIDAGYKKFNLDLIDGMKCEIGTLFTYFKHWKNLILTKLLSTLHIFLWSLLFIIPGIIATYKYAMVPYILAEHPEMRPREALEMSEEMMRGNKWRLFCLYFSFIGWHLLCLLSVGIGYIWLIPYINASVADFYREVSGTRFFANLTTETENV